MMEKADGLGGLLAAAVMLLIWLGWVWRLLRLNLRSLRQREGSRREGLPLSPREHRFLAGMRIRWDR
ncbi:MAG: hypothetical protein ACUVS7_11060 [Bryobacteraceae bacterium]